MNVKVRKKVEKLERKRAKVIVKHHIKRWNKMKLPPEVQLERITFILENREKHSKLLSEPLIEELEKTRVKLEKKVRKSDGIEYYSKMGKLFFNGGAIGALAAGLSYSLGYLIPPQTALNIRIGGLLTSAVGLVGSVYYQYKFSKSINHHRALSNSFFQACVLCAFTDFVLLDSLMTYYGSFGETDSLFIDSLKYLLKLYLTISELSFFLMGNLSFSIKWREKELRQTVG